MKKILFILIILLFTIPKVVGARGGCCSHHGGVCGCSCCDGTGLSATCAPYYPGCNEAKNITSKTESNAGFDFSDFISTWWWALGLGGWTLGCWIKDRIDRRKK